MTRKLTAALLVVALLGAATGPAMAKEKKVDPKVLLQLGMRLVEKRDTGLIATARVAKAATYAKAKQFDKALEELWTLDSEIKDCELLFLTNCMKIVLMNQAKLPKDKVLAELDRIIATAKERRGR